MSAIGCLHRCNLMRSSSLHTCKHVSDARSYPYSTSTHIVPYRLLRIPEKHERRVLITLRSAANDDETSSPQPNESSIPPKQQSPSIDTQPTTDTSTPSPSITESETSTSTSSSSSSSEIPISWQRFFKLCFFKVKTNIWPLLLVHLVCDALVFILHRASHRLTNELAIAFNPSTISPSIIGNMWWLTSDPSIANFTTGYQTLSILVFLLAFPLNILLKSIASSLTIFICKDDAGKKVLPETPWWRPIIGMWRAMPAVTSIWPSVIALWLPVFLVELMVSAAVIPLQFASLAVVTLPFTLPIIVSLYAAVPAVILEGKRGIDAIQRSRQLMLPMKWTLAVPFLGFVIAQRALESAKSQILTNMPARYYKELIEIPVVVLVGGVVVSVIIARMQEVLPYIAFEEGKRKEREIDGA